MTNHRIRSALSARGMTGSQLAGAVGVDPKSVERWMTQGRVPHRGTRARVAEALGYDETYLWPQLLLESRSSSAAQSELVQLWPTRESVPGDVWRSLLSRAKHRIDFLAYSGGFLVEAFGLVAELERLSETGGTGRVLVGDPASDAVRRRGEAEGLPTLPARAASTLDYLSPVRTLDGIEIRTHDAPLYVSIYRFDDEILVNTHTHGAMAKDSPVFHYQRTREGHMFAYYASAFDRVWAEGSPA
ncbi:XRE family transcriptional regulator [Nocardioides sp. NPDC004968]|uniref:XRE family transcriptional regulator n=1 Tax=Nocardioides sp. NPDC004968 TaxID=3155894 RepID=UPI0033A668FB